MRTDKYEVDGVTRFSVEKLGIPWATYRKRRDRGMTYQEAIKVRTNKYGLTSAEMKELGVPETTYRRRRDLGWSHEDAVNGKTVIRDCSVCGETFVVSLKGQSKKTCSKECARVSQNGYAKKHEQTLHYGDPEVSRMMRLWR